MAVYCSRCGKQQSDDAIFCMSCGQPLKTDRQLLLPQKKRRTGLVIGLTVLLLVLVGAGIGGFLYINRSTPEKTLQAYCNALLNKDAQGVDDQMSLREQARVADIAAGLERSNVIVCTYSNVQQIGAVATATLHFTFGIGNPPFLSLTNYDTLIDENGSWKIDLGQNPNFG